MPQSHCCYAIAEPHVQNATGAVVVEDLTGDSHKATYTLGLADETEQIKVIIVAF